MPRTSSLSALASALPLFRSRGRDRSAIEAALEAFSQIGLARCALLDLSRLAADAGTATVYGHAGIQALPRESSLELAAALQGDELAPALALAARRLELEFTTGRAIAGTSGVLGLLLAEPHDPAPAELDEALLVLATALAPELDPQGPDYALRRSGEMLALVMDNIPQHIFWKDKNGIYLGCNRNFAEVAGVSDPQAIIGKSDFDLAWSREESEFFRECDQRVMRNDAPECHIIEPQHQAGGRDAWLDTNKVPLHDEDGNVIGILGTYEDITARLQLEEQLRHVQKMEAVGALAGGIAHDFKNLMMVVIGQAELALRSASEPKLRDMIDVIQQAGHRTASLADKLLMLARRQITRPEFVDLNAVIRQLVPVIRRAVPENIELAMALLEDEGSVRIDRSAFEQVLLNLTFNAKDAMPEGGRLGISTTRVVLSTAHDDWSPEARLGEHLCLEVSDNGVGMSSEVQSRAFEPFFTTKGIGRGTGLGLSIVYGAVKQAGGHVTLDTTLGRGTRFRIYLPRAERRASSLPAPTSRVTAQQREIVLVVEDEPQVRQLAVTMLQELGHAALEASNGHDALRIAAEHPELTVLLTDFVMPILGGREFIARFSAAHPTVRILCMSGYSGTADDIEHAQTHGVRFLPKPFMTNELGDALAELRQRGPYDAARAQTGSRE
jgi:two-component system, cell cycle sensor histidine kinase and response regulator CckA